MKMIASTKLAKAQRAMQAGKEYGIANTGTFFHLYRSRHVPNANVYDQKSSNTRTMRIPASASSSS